MFLSEILYRITIIALVVLLVLLGVSMYRTNLALAKAEQELSEYISEAKDKLIKQQEAARATEQSLNEQASEARKKANDEINTLVTHRTLLLNRLRDYKGYSSDLSEATTTTSDGRIAVTDAGASVLGTIGEEDVEEALRADTIRLQLISCYRQYNQARKALNTSLP